MRCKNCGSQNDDNLYICQNCGSPLYDEEDNAGEQEFTRVAPPIRTDRAKGDGTGRPSDAKKDNQNKSLTIIIIVLSVLLVAMITGIIVMATSNHNKKVDNQGSSTSLIDSDTTEDNYEVTQSKPSSTTSTTEKTTESTTESTTLTRTYTVTLTSNGGGEYEGDGTYKAGKRVTLIARADDGYEFDGWYKGNTKISGNTLYRFSIDSDIRLEARFLQVEDWDLEDEDDGVYEDVDEDEFN